VTNNPDLETGGPGFVIFRSQEINERFQNLREHPASASAGPHFKLAPFIPEVTLPSELFVLGFGRKNLRLYHCSGAHCRKVELPEDVPESVEAAERARPGDRQGSLIADVHEEGGTGVHSGGLGDREGAGDYLHYFILEVDRGLRDTLAGKPLLLTGVHEELNAYRRTARYEHILAAEISGSTEYVPLPEIGAQAAKALEEEHQAAAEKAVTAWREMTDRSRVASGLREVLRASREGRVHKLFIPAVEPGDPADTDQVDAAVAETLRHSGDVLAVPPASLPEVIGAVLRY